LLGLAEPKTAILLNNHNKYIYIQITFLIGMSKEENTVDKASNTIVSIMFVSRNAGSGSNEGYTG
jgi:hypothetical protein